MISLCAQNTLYTNGWGNISSNLTVLGKSENFPENTKTSMKSLFFSGTQQLGRKQLINRPALH